MNNGRSRAWQAFALLSLSIAVALLICEVIVRVVSPDRYYVWPPHLKQVFKPDPSVMPGISGDSRFEINSLGLRGDELDDSDNYRVLAVGGSTTECLYLDQAETWPSLVQQRLTVRAHGMKVWVGNAGMAGRTTRNHLAVLRYLPLEDMRINTVVLLIGVNDFHNFSPDYRHDRQFLTSKEFSETVLYDTFKGGMRHENPADPFYKRSALWRLVRNLKDDIVRRSERDRVQDQFGKVLVTWRNHRKEAKQVLDELPDLQGGLEEYRNNINEIVNIAVRRHLRLILMTQPTMWRRDLPADLENLLWLGGIGDFQSETGKPYYSVKALADGMQRYNETLLDVCRTRKLECIDLSILPKDTSVFYDDVHFNESGASKVADILTEHLLAREPFAERE